MKTAQIKTFEDLQEAGKYFNVAINEKQLELFRKYHSILLEWNKKINLVSRVSIDQVLEKHFLDSILFLPEIEGLINQAPTVLDIGSGGGFPAIPLAIIKSNWNFALCESVRKKADFLIHLIDELKFENRIKIINDRVEAIHESPLHKNKYDLVTTRAVEKINVLIKYALPLLKKNGYLIAYKAKEIDDEIKNVEKLIKKNKLELKILPKEINGVVRKLVTIRHCEEVRSTDETI